MQMLLTVKAAAARQSRYDQIGCLLLMASHASHFVPVCCVFNQPGDLITSR